MKAEKLDLADLQPEEAELSLSNGKSYTLKRFSLREQIWLKNTFGEQDIRGIFKDQRLDEISQIAYHLIKDKTDFPTIEDFQGTIVNTKDKGNLIMALLHTIGISQPVIKKLAEDIAEKKSQPRQTGA